MSGIGEVVSAGEVIDSRYRVERRIGGGGMGTVVLATHLQLRELVAIKFLHPDAAADESTRQRFLREARTSARLHNEHVVRVMDFGFFESGAPIIVMEYLEGKDLGKVLAERGPLPVEDAVEYLLQACEALAEAHARGMIHRDLKPPNLYLTKTSDGSPLVKILDFGISKVVSETDDSFMGAVVTGKHELLGSPAYMSPEQICSRPVDARSDVWSMGVVLYELLTDELVFDRPSLAEVFTAVLHSDPPPLRELAPGAPAQLELLIASCLKRDPKERCPDIATFAERLAEAAPTDARRLAAERVHRLLRGSIADAQELDGSDSDQPLSTSVTVWRKTKAIGEGKASWSRYVFVAGALVLAVGGGFALSQLAASSSSNARQEPGPSAALTEVTSSPALSSSLTASVSASAGASASATTAPTGRGIDAETVPTGTRRQPLRQKPTPSVEPMSSKRDPLKYRE